MNNDKNDRSAITILFGEAEKSADELHKKFSDGAINSPTSGSTLSQKACAFCPG